VVYHEHAPTGGFLYLHTNAAVNTSAWSDVFNTTNPTASVISIGTSDAVNKSGDSIVCYCWHHVEGFSYFDVYEGSNDADEAPFFWLGFRPAIIMFKNVDAVENWQMFINKDSGYNPANNAHLTDERTQRDTGTDQIDLLSNGFRIRSTDVNTSNTYVFAAWAEMPSELANAR